MRRIAIALLAAGAIVFTPLAAGQARAADREAVTGLIIGTAALIALGKALDNAGHKSAPPVAQFRPRLQPKPVYRTPRPQGRYIWVPRHRLHEFAPVRPRYTHRDQRPGHRRDDDRKRGGVHRRWN